MDIATVYVPLYSWRGQTEVEDRANWPEFIGNANIAMLGIPTAMLFKNLSEEQIADMYNDEHMNVNGQRRK